MTSRDRTRVEDLFLECFADLEILNIYRGVWATISESSFKAAITGVVVLILLFYYLVTHWPGIGAQPVISLLSPGTCTFYNASSHIPIITGSLERAFYSILCIFLLSINYTYVLFTACSPQVPSTRVLLYFFFFFYYHGIEMRVSLGCELTCMAGC